ncbi:MAG: TIGR01777 family protein [Flavobacteriaceae bacterium]|nr:TIGR01777 family protein [Flavobacteriaceae bacterium]
MKKIIIAGGSGFLGSVLERYFSENDYKVFILTRTPEKENHIYWDAKNLGKWSELLENSEALINLTGKSVDCRYTKRNKKMIYNSRIDSTAVLGLAISKSKNPPKTWINSSTATIYEHSEEILMTERNGIIGDDFSMNIAKSWEKTFYQLTTPKTRKIVIRTAIVMGKKGGALPTLKRLVKLRMGGKQGSGKQKVSWIHEHDFARAIHYLISNSHLEGNFNVTVPQPTDNQSLMSSLRNNMLIPFGINHPEWLLEVGALLIGTETELILKSRNVFPERLLEEGFNFNYQNIDHALKSLL